MKRFYILLYYSYLPYSQAMYLDKGIHGADDWKQDFVFPIKQELCP